MHPFEIISVFHFLKLAKYPKCMLNKPGLNIYQNGKKLAARFLHWNKAKYFCDDPPGLLDRLDSRGRGVLILLEALLIKVTFVT